MNKLKGISIVWGIVAVLLFAGLTAMGFIYKEKTKKYKELEKDLVKITKKYTATDFNFPASGEEKIITVNELQDAKLINELKVDKNKCNGYVVLTFDGVVQYKAYVDCEKYKTHNYDSSKLEDSSL